MDEIHALKTEISFLKLKLALAENILNSHNDSIDNYYKTNIQENSIDIYGKELTVIVHENLSNCPRKVKVIKKTIKEETKKKRITQPGNNFRAVRNMIKLVDEKPAEQEEKINKIQEEIAEIIPDDTIKNVNDRINILFEELQKARVYKKTLQEIAEARIQLLGKLNLNDYTKTINNHIIRLQSLFSAKKYDIKKSNTLICSSLSSLDQRLSFFPNYYNSGLSPEETEKLDRCLKANITYCAPTRYVPFSIENYTPKLLNYSLAIFSIRYCMKNILINPYGFPNLVYLPLEKSTAEDPYSFYKLVDVNDNRRNWRMEIRLDSFCKNIGNSVNTYGCALFRRIYKDVFSDNIYREEYHERCIILKQDCEQLLQNMITICRHKQFCDMIRDVVIEHCTLKPTISDKFDFTADDKINKIQYNQDNSEEEKENIYLLFSKLFDGISKDQIDNLVYRYP